MDINHPAAIIIKRNWNWAYGAVSFEVSIDDQMFGRLSVREIKQFFVTPGPHKIRVSSQSSKTQIIEFNSEADKVEVFECGALPLLKYVNPLSWLKPDTWIYLRKSENPILLEAASKLFVTGIELDDAQ